MKLETHVCNSCRLLILGCVDAVEGESGMTAQAAQSRDSFTRIREVEE